MEISAGARFCSACGQPLAGAAPSGALVAYTRKHLAEKILTSKAALEGERKHVTVLFADMKGSTELPAEIAVCSEPLDAQSAQQHYASAPSPGRRTRRRSPQASETSPEKRLSMAAGE